MIGVLLMEIRPSPSKQLMVESDRSAFAKGFLRRNSKTFIGLSHAYKYHIYWSAGERYWAQYVSQDNQ